MKQGNQVFKSKTTIFSIIAVVTLLFSCLFLNAQTISFPGAEGFGKFASGGRGGKIIKVTNLNDSGEGSLRKAIQAHGPRIVIFTVSGNIELKSELRINNPDITIAGQSAPGDGITISHYPFGINADNVIIRFMRFRLGDEFAVQDDALGGRNHSNILVDHCSMSWATDEGASFYHNKNFTMQWCIISEALNESVHKKGKHGYGGIWGGEGASFHHNLIANNNSRNPRFSGSETTANTKKELVDFRNNVIYNWGDNSIYGGESGSYNIVNNYFKPGLATSKSKRNRIVNPSVPFGKFYVEGNYMVGSPEVTADNSNGGVQAENFTEALADKAFVVDEIATESASEAYKNVLAKAGASYKRDPVDTRVIQEVCKGYSVSGKNKNGIIDSQKDVGGWPVLKSKPYAEDTDNDGIPDEWEKKNGLDYKVDNSGKRNLSSAYDDIEVYLNSLVEHIIK